MLSSLLISLALIAEPVVRARMPVFNPAGGSYTGTQSVTITTTSVGAAIYCTTDGSTPRRVASLRYTTPLSVSANTTLRCIAYRDDRQPSLIARADYTITVGGYQSPSQLYAAASSTCAAFPIRSTGVKYYFCDCQTGAETGCVAGNDANTGLTPAAAKRTWTAALTAFNAMNAGDTIAFCKGGAWAVTSGAPASCSNQIVNPRCAAGASLTDPANTSTCDIRDYQASWGGTARPSIRTASTANTYILTTFNGTMAGVRIFNLGFLGSNLGPRGGVYGDSRGFATGSCGPENDSNFFICNNTFGNLYLGLNIAENNSQASNFIIRGNRFEMCDLDGILGSFGTGSSIDANYFDNNGGGIHPTRGNNAHSLYINGNGAGSVGVSVINNEFRRTGTSDPNVGLCENGIAVGHGVFNGLNFENNLVDGGPTTGTSCWGVDFSAGGSQATSFTNTTIRGNWTNTIAVGIALGQAPSSTIENNVIVMPGVHPGGWKRGILQRDLARPEDGVTNNLTVRNNTIWINGSASSYYAIDLSTEGTGHVIANNSVYAGTTCFYTGSLTAGAFSFIGNNACYNAAWGTTYDATTHVTSNPLYANATTDFTPQDSSPLINAGSSTYGSTLDFYQRARSGVPDIGAVEWISTYKSPATLYAEAQATCTAFPLRHSGTCPTGATCSSSPTHYTHFFCDCAAAGVNTAPGADAGCVAGNDGNVNPSNNTLDCTNPNAPCQTLGTAGTVFSRMPAGDSIAFCRGGAFTTAAKIGLWNTQCSGSADPRVPLNNTTCDIRDYPTSWGTKAPVLRPSGTTPLFQNDSDNGRTVSGVRILNLDMEGDGTGPESCILRGSFGMEIGTLTANDYFFCNNTIRGFRIGLYPNSNYNVTPLPPQPTRFQLWGNYFTLNGQDAIYGGGTDVRIDANRMIDNGGTTCGGGGQGHQWYPNATGVAPAGGGPTRFTNNEVRFVTVNCRTVILGAHGPRFDGFLVENNIFDAGNSTSGMCWLGGPTGDSGYNAYSPQWQRGFVFRGNWWRGAGWVGVICSQCPGAIIENNILISTANSTAGQMLVDVPDHSREVPALDDITSNVSIRNNTFYFEGAQGGRYAIAVPAYNRDGPLVEEGDGFVISNNVIYYEGGAGQCWRTDWSDWRYTAVTNNACYRATGYDATPATNTLTGSPTAASLWVNPPTDFTPAPGSPLINAGSNTYKATSDYYLKTRSSPPDIGAVER